MITSISKIIYISVLLSLTTRYHSNSNKKVNVILLHGLGRTHLSMLKLKIFLEKNGYKVFNFPFSTLKKTTEEIEKKLEKYIKKHGLDRDEKIYFVTHSFGGIIARLYLAKHPNLKKCRIVMLAPPNKGSKLAEKLKNNKIVRALLNPPIEELGKDKKSLPLKINTPDYEIGIIAGTKNIFPFFSKIISAKSDGIISVEETKLENMKDFTTVNSGHTFIMQNKMALKQILHFLDNGHFIKINEP